MMLVNRFLVNLTSDLLQCTLHALDFLWFDIFDVTRIQNMTLRAFYERCNFKVLGFCTQLCFRLYFEYSMFPENEKIAI